MGRPADEIDEVLADLDTLLKNPEVGAELAGKGVNISLAMVLVDGVRAYLRGEKQRAVDELETAVEEIAARLAMNEPPS